MLFFKADGAKKAFMHRVLGAEGLPQVIKIVRCLMKPFCWSGVMAATKFSNWILMTVAIHLWAGFLQHKRSEPVHCHSPL